MNAFSVLACVSLLVTVAGCASEAGDSDARGTTEAALAGARTVWMHADGGLHRDLQKALGLPELGAEAVVVDGVLRVVSDGFSDTLELRATGWMIWPGQDQDTLVLRFGGSEDGDAWRAADAMFRAMSGVPKEALPTHVGMSWTRRSPNGRIVCRVEDDFGAPTRTFCTINALRSVRQE